MDDETMMDNASPPQEPVSPNPRRTTLIVTCAVLVLISCCCIAGAGLVVWFDPFDWNLLARITGTYDAAAEAVPADAEVYVGLDLLQLQTEDANRVFRAFAEANPDSQLSSAEDFLDSLDDELADTGISFTEDILSWVGQHVGVGIYDFTFSNTGDVDTVQFVFAAAIRDRPAAEAFSVLLEQRVAENGGTAVQTADYEGTTIYFAPTFQNDGIAFAIHRSLFLISTTQDNIRRSIDSVRGESFMDSEDFRMLSRTLPRRGVLTAFVRSSLVESLNQQINTGLVSGFSAGSSFLWDVGSFSLSFVPEGLRLDTVAIFDRETAGEVQRQVIDSFSDVVTIDARVPQNTLFLLAGRRLDLNYALLRERFRDADQAQDFEEAMDAFALEFGFHPETDLLAHLDGEYAVAIVPSTDGFPPSNNINLGLDLIFETSNPAGLAPAIDALEHFLETEVGVAPAPIEVDGQVIQQVADPFVGELLAYTLTNDLLVLTTSARQAGDILAGGSSLRDNPTYQAAWESFPAGMRPALYLDVANLLGTIREGLPADALLSFEADFAGFFGPVSRILMGNQFIGADTQQATLIVFVEGGSE